MNLHLQALQAILVATLAATAAAQITTSAPGAPGCSGSNGVPAMVPTSGPAQINTMIQFGMINGPADGAAVLVLGDPMPGGVPYPADDLSFLGMTGCFSRMALGPAVPVTLDATGSIMFTSMLLNDPSTVGSYVGLMFFVRDVPANSFGVTVTDVMTLTIQP